MIARFDEFSNAVGIVGVGFLILAYFLLSTNRLSAQSLKYQLFNLVGALQILFSLLFHFNLASFVIEIVWIMISLTGIYRIVSSKKKQTNAVANVYQFDKRCNHRK
jgi:hypothetical protein